MSFLRVAGAVASGASQGLDKARQAERQRLLDSLKVEDLSFRKTAARMLADRQQKTLDMQEAENASQERLRTAQTAKAEEEVAGLPIERRRKAVAQLLGPLTYKDKEVADRTAPQRAEFEGYVNSPVGGASLDDNDPVLMGEHRRLVDEATATANDVYKRRDEAAKAKVGATNARTAAYEAYRTRLSPAQGEKVIDIDTALGDAHNVDSALGSVDPNMYNLRVNAWLNKYGAGAGVNQSFILFQARTARELANYVKSVSGQAVAEPEFRRLEKIVVSPDDSVGAAITKSREFVRYLNQKRTIMLRVYKAMGKTWDKSIDKPPTFDEEDSGLPSYAEPAGEGE